MIVAAGWVRKERVGVDIADARVRALDVAIGHRAGTVGYLSGAAVEINDGVSNRQYGILNAALEVAGDSAVRDSRNVPENPAAVVCGDDTIA